VNGQHLPIGCVCHLFGFSRTKIEARMACVRDKNSHHHFAESDIVRNRNVPHRHTGLPSNRTVNNTNMEDMIIAWLNGTLESLVDHSPSDKYEYMPCYIKPKDLLADCCHHLRVSETIFFKVN
jgi:hypothetical protein